MTHITIFTEVLHFTYETPCLKQMQGALPLTFKHLTNSAHLYLHIIKFV